MTRSLLESSAIESDSLVWEIQKADCRKRVPFLGYGVGIWETSTPNPKYLRSPIAKKYGDRKLKSICYRR